MEINVIKATGEKEPFDEEKLRSSIARAGIPKDLRDEVVAHIEGLLRPDIPTSEIYNHILEFLGRSAQPHSRAKYSLKQAIMALGPSGYPFEKFVAAVLRHYGYETEVGITVPGKCVSHEIDVLAKKEGKTAMVECKFHNQTGTRSDIKTALYVRARFEDLAPQFDEAWLVTNTKCTSEAIAYGECAGVKIIAWGYPEGESLAHLVEKYFLYPITCLSSLSGHQKSVLLENNVVLCRDLESNQAALSLLALAEAEKSALQAELGRVLKPGTEKAPVIAAVAEATAEIHN